MLATRYKMPPPRVAKTGGDNNQGLPFLADDEEVEL